MEQIKKGRKVKNKDGKVRNKDGKVRNKGGKVKNKGGNVFDREEPPWVIKYSTYVGGNRAEYWKAGGGYIVDKILAEGRRGI